MANEPTPIGDIISTLFSTQMATKARAQTKVAHAWFFANGDRERAHTTGVWTRAGAFEGADPVLCVAIDSGLLAQELSCNKDIYLARLAYAGVAVSDIRFSVCERPREEVKRDLKKRKEEPKPLPPLSKSEQRQVEEATKNLPDGLRQSASQAMCASLRRNKANTSRKS